MGLDSQWLGEYPPRAAPLDSRRHWSPERRHPAGEFPSAAVAGKDAGALKFIVPMCIFNLEVEAL